MEVNIHSRNRNYMKVKCKCHTAAGSFLPVEGLPKVPTGRQRDKCYVSLLTFVEFKNKCLRTEVRGFAQIIRINKCPNTRHLKIITNFNSVLKVIWQFTGKRGGSPVATLEAFPNYQFIHHICIFICMSPWFLSAYCRYIRMKPITR
jgi:hypothetical protein